MALGSGARTGIYESKDSHVQSPYTNTSGYGMEAVLSQEGGSDMLTMTLKQQKKLVLHIIAYYSATFTPTQRNYDVYDQEPLVIMMALNH
jgi:hypothetical protein